MKKWRGNAQAWALCLFVHVMLKVEPHFWSGKCKCPEVFNYLHCLWIKFRPMSRSRNLFCFTIIFFLFILKNEIRTLFFRKREKIDFCFLKFCCWSGQGHNCFIRQSSAKVTISTKPHTHILLFYNGSQCLSHQPIRVISVKHKRVIKQQHKDRKGDTDTAGHHQPYSL